jgi:hypothetical protein
MRPLSITVSRRGWAACVGPRPQRGLPSNDRLDLIDLTNRI